MVGAAKKRRQKANAAAAAAGRKSPTNAGEPSKAQPPQALSPTETAAEDGGAPKPIPPESTVEEHGNPEQTIAQYDGPSNPPMSPRSPRSPVRSPRLPPSDIAGRLASPTRPRMTDPALDRPARPTDMCRNIDLSPELYQLDGLVSPTFPCSWLRLPVIAKALHWHSNDIHPQHACPVRPFPCLLAFTSLSIP